MTIPKTLGSGVSALALGLYLAALPVTVDLSAASDSILSFKTSQAFAKDGRDDDGGRDDRSGSDDRGGDDHGGGRDDRGDDDRSGSGSRSDDRDDDRSGRGGGDDDDDRDDDDRDDDRSGRGGGDDRGDDDSRGRGRGSDDGFAGGGSAAGNGTDSGGLRVVKIEQNGADFEIVYSNGIKEEVEGGRYELKNAAGRTVVERTATAADLSRMQGNVRNSGVQATTGVVAAGRSSPRVPSGSQVRRVEVGTQSIEVSYTTGWREEVERNRYELKDPNNNTVVQRRATQADVDRLMALAR
jgi:hypothetical protein